MDALCNLATCGISMLYPLTDSVGRTNKGGAIMNPGSKSTVPEHDSGLPDLQERGGGIKLLLTQSSGGRLAFTLGVNYHNFHLAGPHITDHAQKK